MLLPSALFLGVFLLLVSTASANQAAAPEPDVLRLAAGLADSSSRMTAIGLSSLADTDSAAPVIDTTWIKSPDEALERLDAGEVELALLPLDDVGPDKLERHPELRAVMKYWPSDDASQDDMAGDLLIARTSLPPERIEAILDIALQEHIVLEAARIDVTRLTPEDALSALPITAHDGVVDYLERLGKATSPIPRPAARPAVSQGDPGQETVPTPGYSRADILAARLALEAESSTSKSFTLYFETGETAIDRADFKSVAAACNYAASLSKARFVISGHTDTVGTDADNRLLSNRRASAVADAIRNDPRFREALSVIEFGEQHLAVATGDEVEEPKNRRVEITVLETQ